MAAFVAFYHMLKILKGTPCRFFEIFLCVASSSGSLPHKFQNSNLCRLNSVILLCSAWDPLAAQELQSASNVDGRVHSFPFLRDQSLTLFVFQLYNCLQWEVKFSSSSCIMAEIRSALLFRKVNVANRKCVIGRVEARFLNEARFLKPGQPLKSGQMLHCHCKWCPWRCVIHSLNDSLVWSRAGWRCKWEYADVELLEPQLSY